MADTFDTPDPLIERGERESQQPPDDEIAHAEIDIDIEALAEKVYRLMLAEIRLDRARGLSSSEGE